MRLLRHLMITPAEREQQFQPGRGVPWIPTGLQPAQKGGAGRATGNEGVDGRRVLRVLCREDEWGASKSQTFSMMQPQFFS